VALDTHSSDHRHSRAAGLVAQSLPAPDSPCTSSSALQARASLLGVGMTGHLEPRSQNAADGCVDGRFCCCRCHVRSPLVGGGGLGVGGCNTELVAAHCAYDDGLPMRWLLAASMVSKAGFLYYVAAFTATTRHLAAMALTGMDSAGGRFSVVCSFSFLDDGLFAQANQRSFTTIDRLNRHLVMCFFKAAPLDGTVAASTSPA